MKKGWKHWQKKTESIRTVYFVTFTIRMRRRRRICWNFTTVGRRSVQEHEKRCSFFDGRSEDYSERASKYDQPEHPGPHADVHCARIRKADAGKGKVFRIAVPADGAIIPRIL